MRLRRSHVSPGAVALAAVAVFSSCGQEPQGTGVLGNATGFVSQCVPVPGEAPVVFADEILENNSDRQVTLDEVRLVEPYGLRVTDAFLLPIRNRTLLGTTIFPPSGPQWDARRGSMGAEVVPGDEWNLALVLHRGSRPGGFADVEVDFNSDGNSYTHRHRFALRLLSTSTC